MVNKTNLSAFAYMTNKKFTCITVTIAFLLECVREM